MSSPKDTFATAFNCMDGRCQEAVRVFAIRKWGVEWVDVITAAGIDGILAGKACFEDQPTLKCLKFEAAVSTDKHGSRHAVVVGHTKCGGNPISNEEHLADIRKAVDEVRSWNKFETVVGLMATEEHDGEWAVVPVEEYSQEVLAV